ncbi:MAG: UDP-N-acetylmuramate dehydrogenase [Candidatus Aminicenantales bacterium]
MKPTKGEFSAYFSHTVGKPLQQSVLLSLYSNFRIGGPADYFFEAGSASELRKAVQAARDYKLPYYVIGGGYNLLFDNEGYRGLIIKNSVKSLRRIGKSQEIEISAGFPLSGMVHFCLQQGLAGFEFLAGIPGTVGGAIFGNAGAFGDSIGRYLKAAFLLNERGEELRVDSEYFAFDYRSSFLKKRHYLLLKAVFSLRPGEPPKIKKKIEENLAKREKKHPPLSVACAGSYFKNPLGSNGKKIAAAYLLEQVGAKNLKVGQAAVHPFHSNFIINLGEASCRDILSLAEKLKRKVRDRFGLELEEEVIYLPVKRSML